MLGEGTYLGTTITCFGRILAPRYVRKALRPRQLSRHSFLFLISKIRKRTECQDRPYSSPLPRSSQPAPEAPPTPDPTGIPRLLAPRQRAQGAAAAPQVDAAARVPRRRRGLRRGGG
eukprot:350219-Chlamydomonas_euryale.AAC.1